MNIQITDQIKREDGSKFFQAVCGNEGNHSCGGGTMSHYVSFGNRVGRVTRWRRIDGQTSHGGAIEAALRSLRSGVLARASKRRLNIAAYVTDEENKQRYDAKKPCVVHGYSLALRLNPDREWLSV